LEENGVTDGNKLIEDDLELSPELVSVFVKKNFGFERSWVVIAFE